jgi:hypothetical protein
MAEMVGMAEWSAKILAWELNWDERGGMAEWRNGYLPTTFMVHADDNTDTF